MSEIKTNPASSPLLRLIGAFRKRWGWVVLIVFALVIRLFAMNAEHVEVYYSQGIYPFISSLLRGALNWLPLSVGDLLYGLVALYGIGKAISMIKRVIAGSHTPTYWLAGLVLRH